MVAGKAAVKSTNRNPCPVKLLLAEPKRGRYDSCNVCSGMVPGGRSTVEIIPILQMRPLRLWGLVYLPQVLTAGKQHSGDSIPRINVFS